MEYIKDNGRIRQCDSNIAKMNILQYFYHFALRRIPSLYLEKLVELGVRIWESLLIIGVIVFAPIIIFIEIILDIKRAKAHVKQEVIRNGNSTEDLLTSAMIPVDITYDFVTLGGTLTDEQSKIAA